MSRLHVHPEPHLISCLGWVGSAVSATLVAGISTALLLFLAMTAGTCAPFWAVA